MVALGAAVLVLAGGGAVAVLDRAAPEPAPAPTARARGVLAPDPTAQRTQAVQELLVRRAWAVRARDRAAFLATVDPAGGAFRARQGRLADGLAGVPLLEWTYALDPTTAEPGDPALDARYGTWWAPRVVLRYRYSHVGPGATTEVQHLTFVEREGQWYVGADDDFAPTPRGLWDGGPVLAVRGTDALVLGRPGKDRLLRVVADQVDAAVPRVTAVWGRDWARKVVVVVPGDKADLAALVPGHDLSRIAAVALADAPDPPGSGPVADRVVVNPDAFGRLGAVGRRVVLTHEVTHVATRAATGPHTPAWLVEGFADHVGYLGAQVPLRRAARELRADVRAGRLPSRLPTLADFDGGNPGLPQAYEQAWLAVLLVEQGWGRARLLALYRAMGSAPTAAAAEQALRRELGLSTAALTQRWRRDLAARLR